MDGDLTVAAPATTASPATIGVPPGAASPNANFSDMPDPFYNLGGTNDPVQAATKQFQQSVQGPQIQFNKAQAQPQAQPQQAPAPDAQTVPQTAGPSMQTPQAAPGAYQVPTGEQGPTRMDADQALDLIQHYEDASGDPAAKNYMYDRYHTAGGLLQITDTNWKKYAPTVGIDTNQFPSAISTAALGPDTARELQRRVGKAMYQKEGFAPWAPFNPALRKAIGWQGGQFTGAPGTAAAGSLNAQYAQTEQETMQALQNATGMDMTALQQLMQVAGKSTNEQIAVIQAAVADQRKYLARAEAAREAEATTKVAHARELLTDDQKLQQWVAQTPTRQAAYANVMHLTPMLSILAALGGKATRVSALGMLGATAGIVQGVNAGAENQFKDAVDKWNNQYDALKAHMKNMDETYQTLETAYAGRADAADKAATMALKIEGDELTAAQLKFGTAKTLFDAVHQTTQGMVQNQIAFQKIQENLLARQYATGMADPKAAAIAWELTARGVKVPQRTLMMAIEGGLMEHPDWTAEQFAQAAQSGRWSQLYGEWFARTLSKRISNTVVSTWPLVKPGGLYDVLEQRAEAFANSVPGLTDTQIGAQVAAAIAGYNKPGSEENRHFYDSTYTSPSLQAYVTTLEETRAELKQSLSKQGMATDEVQRRTDMELPEWKGLEALKAGIQASRQIGYLLLQGDSEVQQDFMQGKDPLQIVKEAAARGGDPNLAQPGVAGAVVEAGGGEPQYQHYVPGTDRFGPGTPSVATADDYNKLAPGTEYRAPDGSIRRKSQ